jgi:hypothetical protein
LTGIASQVGHLAKISDAALVDPTEQLSGVKSRPPERRDGIFELGNFELRDIVAAFG